MFKYTELKEVFTERTQMATVMHWKHYNKYKTNKNHKQISVKCLYEYKESIKPSLGGSIAMD